ncbi:ribonuclease P protein component [Candidatus Falkowbacteria bacterium]|nr:ribonuclease P protein component [Candidatus Falkowbacteria bacterium]
MLKKINRLTKKKDIGALMKHGKPVYFLFLIIKYKQNSLPYPRFAIVVSTKVSKKATKRNLIKRRISEIVRLNLAKIAKGYDIVVIVSPKIINNLGKTATYEEIEKNLLGAFKKVKLI